MFRDQAGKKKKKFQKTGDGAVKTQLKTLRWKCSYKLKDRQPDAISRVLPGGGLFSYPS